MIFLIRQVKYDMVSTQQQSSIFIMRRDKRPIIFSGFWVWLFGFKEGLKAALGLSLGCILFDIWWEDEQVDLSLVFYRSYFPLNTFFFWCVTLQIMIFSSLVFSSSASSRLWYFFSSLLSPSLRLPSLLSNVSQVLTSLGNPSLFVSHVYAKVVAWWLTHPPPLPLLLIHLHTPSLPSKSCNIKTWPIL